MIKTNPLTTATLACVLAIGFGGQANGQANKQRGATFGGLAGAIAGGLIGDHNDEAGAGAAIGGVVGAVAGGILGNAADKDAELRRRQAAYQNAQVYQQNAQAYQYAQAQQATVIQSAVTLQDVISMSRSGLSDQVINNQIRQRGYVGKLVVADIIALHQQGVRESVITTLQTAGPPRATIAVARPAPTVVQQHIVHPQPTVIIQEHVMPSYPAPRYVPHYRHATRGHYYYHH